MSSFAFCRFSNIALPRNAHTFVSLAVTTLIACAGLAQAQNRFPQVSSYAAGGSLPTLLAQHDVNGDGKQDAIVLNINATSKTETVSLLLGNGVGGYETPKTMATYPSSYGTPLAADVNHDGHLDLIFSVISPQQTRVYLGTGETFETTPVVSKGVGCAASAPTYCTLPIELQVADLNKDGKLDLIEGPGSFLEYVLLGNGNGSFRAPVQVTGGDGVFAIGDFNNDGLPDIANFGSNDIGLSGLQVLFGNGNGTFRKGKFVTTGYSGSYGLPLAADLRGNGNTDLILPLGNGQSCGSGDVEVLLGNGDGTFAGNPSTYRTGGFTYNLVVADMNGDKRPDLIVANHEGSTYSVLLNVGGGKFSQAMNYVSPLGVSGNFIAGDLNGDGRPDVTISSKTGVQVLRNSGNGRLLAPGAVELDISIAGPTYAADLNHDGIPDLVTIESPTNTGLICNLFADGRAVLSRNGVPFAGGAELNTPSGLEATDIGLGDFNHDGNIDAAMLYFSKSDFQHHLDVQFNDGKGNFTDSHQDPNLDSDFLGPMVVANFNNDGYADVALLNDQLTQILLGLGNGNFKTSATYSYGISPGFPGSATERDVNGDGKVDIIVLDIAKNAVDVLLGNGNGTFQAPKTYPTVQAPNSISLADFNRDGKVDIVVGGSGQVSVLLGNGNGTFKGAVNYAAGGPVNAVAAIDLRGNGDADVLVADSKDNKLFLLQGNGNGTLQAAVNYYPGGGTPTGLTVADFNQDGAPDVAVADTDTFGYMILYNQGGTGVILSSSLAAPKLGQNVTFTATVVASFGGQGTPTGTVAFKDGSTTIGTAKLTGGRAIFSTSKLSRGTHIITANYWGGGNFNPRASRSLTERVGE